MDYTISYDLGQVTFLNPDALFGQRSGADDRPIRGAGHLRRCPNDDPGACPPAISLGDTGAINLIGMYQREQSAFNRPPLGFEATANLVRRHQHRAPLQARGVQPVAQQPDLELRQQHLRCSTSTPSSPSPSRTRTARARPTSRSSRRRRDCRYRCARRPGSSAARRSRPSAWRHRIRRRLSTRTTPSRSPGRTWCRSALR